MCDGPPGLSGQAQSVRIKLKRTDGHFSDMKILPSVFQKLRPAPPTATSTDMQLRLHLTFSLLELEHFKRLCAVNSLRFGVDYKRVERLFRSLSRSPAEQSLSTSDSCCVELSFCWHQNLAFGDLRWSTAL